MGVVSPKAQAAKPKKKRQEKKPLLNPNEPNESQLIVESDLSESEDGEGCCTCADPREVQGKCADCFKTIGYSIANCPVRTCKMICNPCGACEKCVECTGKVVCGCLDNCETCGPRMGEVICGCTKAVCKVMVCDVPRRIGECLCSCTSKVAKCFCDVCKKTGACICNACTAVGKCACNCLTKCGEFMCTCCRETADCMCSCLTKGKDCCKTVHTKCRECCVATCKTCGVCCRSITSCAKNAGASCWNCAKGIVKAIVECPKNTANCLAVESRRCLNFMKRTTKDQCACWPKDCHKKYYKCLKCMLCFWVCKPCRHWHDDRDKDELKEAKGVKQQLEFNLQGNQLKEFIMENLLVYLDANGKIAYIAVDNKDRI